MRMRTSMPQYWACVGLLVLGKYIGLFALGCLSGSMPEVCCIFALSSAFEFQSVDVIVVCHLHGEESSINMMFKVM